MRFKYRNFCFTLNNPNDAEKIFWTDLASSEVKRTQCKVQYVVFQTEREAQTHLQGYVELTVQMRKSVIKRTFGRRMHIEPRHGTQAQAAQYCQKQDTQIPGICGEGGEMKKSGKDKLSYVAPLVRDNAYNLQELETDYPATFIKFGPKITAYWLNRKGKRNKAPEVIIFYGVTGTGKSSLANKTWPNAYVVPWPRKGGWWWPHYQGQETIILDEFAHQIKYHEMEKLLDRYKYDCQAKGVNYNMISTRIVITTNIDPTRWYPNVPSFVKDALHRRFNDFATIWDFSDDSRWNNIKKKKRVQIRIQPGEQPSFVIPLSPTPNQTRQDQQQADWMRMIEQEEDENGHYSDGMDFNDGDNDSDTIEIIT